MEKPLESTASLAELAARLGKTEDELKEWLKDTPNRHRKITERICASPEFKAAAERAIARSREARFEHTSAGWREEHQVSDSEWATMGVLMTDHTQAELALQVVRLQAENADLKRDGEILANRVRKDHGVNGLAAYARELEGKIEDLEARIANAEAASLG